MLSGAKGPLPLFEALEGYGVWSGQLFGMGEGFFAVSSATASREARLTTVGTPASELDEFPGLDPNSESWPAAGPTRRQAVDLGGGPDQGPHQPRRGKISAEEARRAVPPTWSRRSAGPS